jgi:hypothetical protein
MLDPLDEALLQAFDDLLNELQEMQRVIDGLVPRSECSKARALPR